MLWTKVVAASMECRQVAHSVRLLIARIVSSLRLIAHRFPFAMAFPSSNGLFVYLLAFVGNRKQIESFKFGSRT